VVRRAITGRSRSLPLNAGTVLPTRARQREQRGTQELTIERQGLGARPSAVTISHPDRLPLVRLSSERRYEMNVSLCRRRLRLGASALAGRIF
jgi:hypothetical protein